MAVCVREACCVFHRGEVFLRRTGQVAYRSVGVSSQLRINHVEDGLELLSATAVDRCCGLLGASVELTVQCIGDTNLALGIMGEKEDVSTLTAATKTDTFTVNATVQIGDLLPFSFLADLTEQVAVTGLATGEYEVVPGGIRMLVCKDVVVVTAAYTVQTSNQITAGAACDEDQELLYLGTNAFDGTRARLYIPKVRLKVVESFDWINPSNAAELALQGRIIFDDAWYTVQREHPNNC